MANLPEGALADDRRVGCAASAARRRVHVVADELAAAVLYPTSDRLLHHCDAVLRLPGASTGADNDVRLATERGLPVYHDVGEVPAAA